MTSHIASYLTIGGLLLTLGGCNTVEPSGGKAAADKPSGMAATMPTSTGPDGTLPLPADYKSWPKFLTDIPKGEANRSATSTSTRPAQEHQQDRTFRTAPSWSWRSTKPRWTATSS